jgi:nicotinate-nucleotide pyrophosphorylase (carboxylating)
VSLKPLAPETLRRAAVAAIEEDLGTVGDVTTDAVIDEHCRAAAHVDARQALVLAGLPLAREVWLLLDPTLRVQALQQEGAHVGAGERLLSVTGLARPILRGERAALNFLGRLCGIATATARAVDEVAGTGARILDTRKTAPGLRELDKYAVRAGGGENHRLGLYDAVMIKDTHLAATGGIREAVAAALRHGHAPSSITVEVCDLAGLEEAIASGAGRALLDNMSLELLREAVRRGKGRIELEASGGLRPGRLREVAATGVEFLSLGWLTHSAAAADVALELEALS